VQDANTRFRDTNCPEPTGVYKFLNSRLGNAQALGHFGLTQWSPRNNFEFLHALTVAKSRTVNFRCPPANFRWPVCEKSVKCCEFSVGNSEFSVSTGFLILPQIFFLRTEIGGFRSFPEKGQPIHTKVLWAECFWHR
jgi:hypothetical protein